MSFDANEKQWKCVKSGTVTFQRVSSIVRDIGEPCFYQSPIKMNKMLKREKWQATFDTDGKIPGFQKVLKLIILGGVDPSIRAEVWEFLLGCYSLSSTAEYRTQLRTARRERYRDLVKQCQVMHSNIGTGSLAYIVGSKIMDMRISSKENEGKDAEAQSGQITESCVNDIEDNFVLDCKSPDKSYMCQKESSNDSGDLLCVRGSTMGGAYGSSRRVPSPDPSNCSSHTDHGTHKSNCVAESCLDFPALPVFYLFEENDKDTEVDSLHEDEFSPRHKLMYENEHMHSFQIDDNADLVVESDIFPSKCASLFDNSKSEIINPGVHESLPRASNLENEAELLNRLDISDVKGTPAKYATTSQGGVSEDRVSEWRWALHRIVVDVVRTDSDLEFYEDSKNLARMSDILAVYAWVDPATGYCQGMSDLLSPFVVLFEDDADAFWCFEMLLRRMRENFKMDGPTGVMKQLQALWHILELTDREMFTHLTHTGAQNLHFAFRMLLVLFRRELSFNEALCMWEMIWAADFNVSLTCLLEENCPDVLSIHLTKARQPESGEETTNRVGPKGRFPPKHTTLERSMSDDTGMTSISTRPFCGLTKNFWSRNDRCQIRTLVTSTNNGDDELPVFCVAAILIMNRHKIIRETRSIDDLIKIFNDNTLKIRVRRCVRTAIKLRKKYFYKLIKSRSPATQNGVLMGSSIGTYNSNGNGEWGVPSFQHQQTISMDWTPQEQLLLEEALSKYASEANIIRYAKIAVQLKSKTVRDVALRCRWMTKKENNKRRKNDFNARKIKDRKEKVIDSLAKPSFLAIQSGLSRAQGLISNSNDDSEVGGATRQLLQQNAWVFKQISTNFATRQTRENICLLSQARDNIFKILSNLNDMGPTMKKMPPLPEVINEELADSILPRSAFQTQ